MTLERATELYSARPTSLIAVALYQIDLVSSFTPVVFKFQSGLVAKASIATEENRGSVSIEEKESLLQLAGFVVRFQMPME